MSEAYLDVEGAVQAHLRADTAVTALAGMRTFFGIPKNATEATFPLIVVARAGGGDDPGEAPLDVAVIQVDCWGKIDASGNGLKLGCTTLVNAVRASLRAMGTIDPVTGAEVGVNIESVIWLPDPDTLRPRYSILAEVAAIVAA